MVTDQESAFLKNLSQVAQDYIEVTSTNAVSNGASPRNLSSYLYEGFEGPTPNSG
jgi:hypothetical protein